MLNVIFLQTSSYSWGFKAIQENGDSVDAVEYISGGVDAVEYISGVQIINASVSPENFAKIRAF